MIKANEKKYSFLMTQTTFLYVSTSKLTCTSFTDRSFLPMVPLVSLVLGMVSMAPLAAETVQGYMVTNDTNGTNW